MGEAVKRLKKEVLALRRKALLDILAQCTPEQQAFFEKIFLCGPQALPEKKIDDAIDLCERTIKKNIAGR